MTIAEEAIGGKAMLGGLTLVLSMLDNMGEQYQRTFIGGMDLLSKDTDIDPTAYEMLFNARNRYGKLQAVPISVNITFNLNGNIQGIYGVSNILLAFCDGRAYYMLIGGTSWLQVPNFQMDATAVYIYAIAVPGSTNNFLRQAVATDAAPLVPDASAGIINNSTPNFAISGTPAGVICQDGVNQPWFITYDVVNNVATARQLGNYNDWNSASNAANAQEYVPIGKQMMYMAPILYIVAPSGYQIYRSVSGSPLNFMVNIDTTGQKLATESLGGAASVSFALDFNEITCITPSTTEAGTFIVGNSVIVYGVQPNYTQTIFGEPTFTTVFQVAAGIVNQFATTDSNGDFPFIDYEGIKFFNAVQQLKFEGDNDPFSKNISSILQGVVQNICAATSFDNYNYFGIKTTLGYLIAVYDNLNSKWVGFDITSASITGVKMFAQTNISSSRSLFCCSLDNTIHQLFADPNDKRECGTLFLRSFVSGEYSQYASFIPDTLREEICTRYMKVQVNNGKQNSTLTCIEQVDYQRGAYLTKSVAGVISAVDYPVFPPVIPNSKVRAVDVLFPFDRGIRGYKLAPILVWTGDMTINVFELGTEGAKSNQSQAQQSAGMTPANKL